MDFLSSDEFSTPFPEDQDQEHHTKKSHMLRYLFLDTILPYFTVIVAISSNNGIGKEGKLPWNISEDMAFFKDITTTITLPERQNVVIMGRKTFESMNMRPLKSRFNICVTKTLKQEDFMNYTNMAIVNEFDDALRLALTVNSEKIFVIGGSQIYNEAIRHGKCGEVICNEIAGDYDCDTFFATLDPNMYDEPEVTIISDRVTSKKYTNKLYKQHLLNQLKDNATTN
jgi:dihydrofolate reductase